MSGRLRNGGRSRPTDKYGATEETDESTINHVASVLSEEDEEDAITTKTPLVSAADETTAVAGQEQRDGLMRTETEEETGIFIEDNDDDEDDEDDEEEFKISIQEILYSSSSYYAIAKPVTLTMILTALCVVFVNDVNSREAGEQAMSQAYQVWQVDGGNGQKVALSLANALVEVTVICCMTFVIVFLYRMKFMKCLIGYMILSSATLLGILGGNLLQVAIQIYNVPVDKYTFYLFVFNFCIVGVLAVFFGQGIPKYVTQGYLIATSVILAWHLNFFDDWATWSLLIMLALYDLCAVLTPCGPLKALVDAMSQEDSPAMPGLLFEAELPREARRPGVPRNTPSTTDSRTNAAQGPTSPTSANAAVDETERSGIIANRSDMDRSVQRQETAARVDVRGPEVKLPLAIAKVYQLNVVRVPAQSARIMHPNSDSDSAVSASPLLQDDTVEDSNVTIPENPTPQQLRALVVVRLPLTGGRIEEVARRGKKVYLERDRHGNPKRILWVDRSGKVFAEMRGDDDEGPDRNTIRLGLGDFIFYSVLVAKAAQYSFATFAACVLVILAGLGGTLVLLSLYHHALPALPISIFLGVVFYFLTRFTVEPWIEAVLSKPYYV